MTVLKFWNLIEFNAEWVVRKIDSILGRYTDPDVLKLLEQVTVLRYKKLVGDIGSRRTKDAVQRIKIRCYGIDADSSACTSTSPVNDWVGGQGDGAARKTALEELLGDMFDSEDNSQSASSDEGTARARQQIDFEMNCYVAEKSISLNSDPLKWWKAKSVSYPFLSKVVKQLFAIPATSVPSERVFSAAGHLVSAARNRLDQENVNMLLFIQQNTTK